MLSKTHVIKLLYKHVYQKAVKSTTNRKSRWAQGGNRALWVGDPTAL